ncbi:hypothetical protein Cgig2_004488 [Carnegiea gigantea]|uniref:ABC1 atypical kinase-like domain-containing protein n=1 Tax=Carnegiea gigantea TaxID=171969 RepID=A0A9Q1Q5Q8_9CARY|nr:hypothetical protein Cgig2_004488 [Carnegiea gigantea]
MSLSLFAIFRPCFHLFQCLIRLGAKRTYCSSSPIFQNEIARAIELREIVTSLGPAYIKLGQALSIRPDILSPAAMTELQKLCDKVPSFPDDVAMALIEEELGKPWHEIYSELSPSPIAAGNLLYFSFLFGGSSSLVAGDLLRQSGQASAAARPRSPVISGPPSSHLDASQPQPPFSLSSSSGRQVANSTGGRWSSRCLEWSSEGYLKSGGLWVSGSRRPPFCRSSFLGSMGCLLFFLRSVRQRRVLVVADQGVGFAGSFCHCRQAQRWILAAGVSPEFPQSIFSGAVSPVLSFGVAVVSGQPRVVVPKTYHKYTSRKVLTTQWIEGEKLSQSTESDVGDLVNVGVICYLKQENVIQSVPLSHDDCLTGQKAEACGLHVATSPTQWQNAMSLFSEN